ncbi:hypothetical protein VNI00_011096 [Paramarasmius palmivorus]|uniref:Uncharacterized protein n=1 Tax=Paramarasmius palmivorus TaxID=297713 RepID=A0AAW0CFR1_9AGAR
MDSGFYDFKEAKTHIQWAVDERAKMPGNSEFLAAIAQCKQWPSSVKVAEMGVPKAYRLISQDEGVPEELVFRLHGVLIGKELPPVERAMSKNTKAKHLRQSVTIAGLGDETFQEALQGLEVVESMFGRYVGTDKLQRHDLVRQFQQRPAMEIYNRYFTPATVARRGDEPVLALGSEVDPKGFLAATAREEYVHTEENKWKRIKISPRVFQHGDIVEVQLSLLAVTVNPKQGTHRMVATLRAITLVDGSMTEKANRKSRLQHIQGDVKASKLKRRYDGESDDDLQEGRNVKYKDDNVMNEESG